MTLLYFILLVSPLVLVHELGHFLTARLMGVTVKELAIGIPPRLLAVRRGGTDYSINAIPLGGFVRLVGEDDPSQPGSLAGKSIPVRMLIISAGSLMNLALAFLIFTVIAALPFETRETDVLVREVAPGSPAAEAGLLSGDEIVAVDNVRIRGSAGLLAGIEVRRGETVQLLVRREQELQLVVRVPPGDEIPRQQLYLGIEMSAQPVVITGVAPGSPAESAGLQAGDVVRATEGEAVHSALHLIERTREYRGQTIVLTIIRDGAEQAVSITPRRDPPVGQGPLGIAVGEGILVTHHTPLWQAPAEGLRQGMAIFVLLGQEIGRWISGAGQPQLAGPIGIAQVTAEVASFGLRPFVQFAALLSLQLAILNILPIPMLDGGKLFFVALEGLRGGRRVSPRTESTVHFIGLLFLVSLIIVVSYFDILRLFAGEGGIP